MKRSFRKRLVRDLRRNTTAYLMVLAVIAYYIVFHYFPMGGIMMAFKDFKPRLGIWASKWVGFTHFESFFSSFYFWRLIRNTLTISISGLIFTFPCAIVFALSVNEVRQQRFKKTVQTISYMPHFISIIVVCSMLRLFLSSNGFVFQLLKIFGYQGEAGLLSESGLFVPIYIISDIWQQTGWNCIIFLAAIAGIDPGLYEAARIDGANRLQQTFHITLPGIAGTIILLTILRIGTIMSVGYEKIILLYNDFTMETADVISSYVYRRGLINGDYSFTTAVGLFNSVINFALVLGANKVAKRVSGYGLW